MLTDNQKRLCMRFASGILAEAAPPEWFARLLETGDDDWEASLARLGTNHIDSFGETERLDVYRSPNGYFINYMDVSESAAWIFIDRPTDYVVFRATILAPLVTLALEGDRAAAEESGVR